MGSGTVRPVSKGKAMKKIKTDDGWLFHYRLTQTSWLRRWDDAKSIGSVCLMTQSCVCLMTGCSLSYSDFYSLF